MPEVGRQLCVDGPKPTVRPRRHSTGSVTRQPPRPIPASLPHSCDRGRNSPTVRTRDRFRWTDSALWTLRSTLAHQYRIKLWYKANNIQNIWLDRLFFFYSPDIHGFRAERGERTVGSGDERWTWRSYWPENGHYADEKARTGSPGRLTGSRCGRRRCGAVPGHRHL